VPIGAITMRFGTFSDPIEPGENSASYAATVHLTPWCADAAWYPGSPSRPALRDLPRVAHRSPTEVRAAVRRNLRARSATMLNTHAGA
jgi:hypothetical protein